MIISWSIFDRMRFFFLQNALKTVFYQNQLSARNWSSWLKYLFVDHITYMYSKIRSYFATFFTHLFSIWFLFPSKNSTKFNPDLNLFRNLTDCEWVINSREFVKPSETVTNFNLFMWNSKIFTFSFKIIHTVRTYYRPSYTEVAVEKKPNWISNFWFN